MAKADKILIELFKEDAQEHMDGLDNHLLEMEKHIGKIVPPNIIDGIYRHLHTLKGASRVINFNAIEQLIHEFEDAIEKLRESKSPASRETFDIYFQCYDAILNAIKELPLTRNELNEFEDDIIKKLNSINLNSLNNEADNNYKIDLHHIEPEHGNKIVPPESSITDSSTINKKSIKTKKKLINKPNKPLNIKDSLKNKTRDEHSKYIKVESPQKNLNKVKSDDFHVSSFTSEALEHINDINNFFFNMTISENPDDFKINSRQFCQHLHSLKGSAGLLATFGDLPAQKIGMFIHIIEEFTSDISLNWEKNSTGERESYIDYVSKSLDCLEKLINLAGTEELPEEFIDMCEKTYQNVLDIHNQYKQIDLTAISDKDTTNIIDPEKFIVFKTKTLDLFKIIEFDISNLGSEKDNIDSYNRLFRNISNILKSSSELELSTISKFSEPLTNLFNLLRKNLIKTSSDVINLLMVSIDVLNQLIETINDENAPPVDLSELISKIEKVISSYEPSNKQQRLDQKKKSQRINDTTGSELATSLKQAKSIRVDTIKLDQVINMMGELVISKIRVNSIVKNLIDEIKTLETSQRDLVSLLKKSKKSANIPFRELASRIVNDTKQNIKEEKSKLKFENYEHQLLKSVEKILIEQSSLHKNQKELILPIENFHKHMMDKISHLYNNVNELIDSNEVLEQVSMDLQESMLKVRMLPIETVFQRFPRLIRDLGRELNKDITLLLSGGKTEVDKTILEEIVDPLVHLLRNAVSHGIEPPKQRLQLGKSERGTINLSAYQQGNQIVVEVSDDGFGIDPEKIKNKAIQRGLINDNTASEMSKESILNLIFLPGFSTSEEVDNVSGRGVGMDVVKTNLLKLKGTISIDSKPQQGTTFRLKLPLTLAIMNALLIEAGGQTFAIPLSSILETLKIKKSEIIQVGNKNVFKLRGQLESLIDLTEILEFEDSSFKQNKQIEIVMVGSVEQRIGLRVDNFLGREEVVIKSLGNVLRLVRHIAGCTILGDGCAILILDIPSIIEDVSNAPTHLESSFYDEAAS